MLSLASAGCAHRLPDTPASSTSVTAPSTLPAGAWEGRLSLKVHAQGSQAAKGVALAFVLEGTPAQGRLDLSTPLGTQVAAVTWQAGQALLDTAEGRRPYASLDILTQEVLGEAVPVQAMMSWLQGWPDPSQPWQPDSAAASSAAPAPAAQTARPVRFHQAGWTVDLTRAADGQIEATRPSTGAQRGTDLKVRLLR